MGKEEIATEKSGWADKNCKKYLPQAHCYYVRMLIRNQYEYFEYRKGYASHLLI